MSALGELLVLFICLLLALAALVFLVLTFKVKKAYKAWTLFASVLFCILIVSYRSCLKDGYKREQLEQVGIYYLTQYPKCDSCILELKEDMTYEVKNKGEIIKKSNWHFEFGGDYLITYLDSDRNELGAGEYSYEHYKLKYSGHKN